MSDAVTTPDECSEERAQWLWHKQSELVHRVELSAMYHLRRARYLTLIERLVQGFTALTATGAYAQLATTPNAGAAITVSTATLGLLTAAASISSLVFVWGQRATHHSIQAADYRRLLCDIQGANVTLTEAQYLTFCGRLHTLEVGERSSLSALVVQCQNELAAAQGQSHRIVRLTFLQRMFMHVWDFRIEPPAPGHPSDKASAV